MVDDAHNAHGLHIFLTVPIAVVLLAVIGTSVFMVVARPLQLSNLLMPHAAATQAAQEHATATVAVLARAVTGPVLYSDPLTNASSQDTKEADWDGKETYTDDANNCAMQSDGYTVTSTLTQGQNCYERTKNFQDFAAQVDMTIASGYAGGLIFRMASDLSDNSHPGCLFEVDSRSNYKVSLLDYTGSTSVTLRDWHYSPAIRSGTTNRLQVVAQGDTLLFYANGAYLWGTKESYSTNGTLGLYAASASYSQNTAVVFRNLDVYALAA